jgi:hypothetical protein
MRCLMLRRDVPADALATIHSSRPSSETDDVHRDVPPGLSLAGKIRLLTQSFHADLRLDLHGGSRSRRLPQVRPLMSVEAREGSYVQPRRHILRFFCSLAFACHFPVWRCEPPKPATQPREARGFGDNLSLAALLYNQGAAPASGNQVLSKAKAIADILGMEIKPFPAKSGTVAAASADMIHYLIEGDGALIGPALTRKYDAEHGTLFEVAVKSDLLILLYAPGERTAQSIAAVIKT